MPGGYNEDFVKALKKQTDIIIQQVMIQMIQLVTESETYDDFRKKMYALALSYIKDMEAEGIKIPDESK
mgnify:CR=1 FL=1